MSRTVYTGGSFDLFHCGHVDLLRRCAVLGKVVVSLNTDDFITSYKGKPPIHNYEERRIVLESCRYVWRVVPNEGGENSKPAILRVNPDYIAIGSDWASRDYYKQMGFTQDWLDEQEIALIYIPRTRKMSSTLVKERVLE